MFVIFVEEHKSAEGAWQVVQLLVELHAQGEVPQIGWQVINFLIKAGIFISICRLEINTSVEIKTTQVVWEVVYFLVEVTVKTEFFQGRGEVVHLLVEICPKCEFAEVGRKSVN